MFLFFRNLPSNKYLGEKYPLFGGRGRGKHLPPLRNFKKSWSPFVEIVRDTFLFRTYFCFRTIRLFDRALPRQHKSVLLYCTLVYTFISFVHPSSPSFESSPESSPDRDHLSSM